MKERLGKIATEDGRYTLEALRFVYEGLGYTVKGSGSRPSHVTGQVLCLGLKGLAVEKWGRLAMLALNTWGVKSTRDFGEIVYLLIRHEWMSTQPDDSIEHFDAVYNFKTVFKDDFKF